MKTWLRRNRMPPAAGSRAAKWISRGFACAHALGRAGAKLAIASTTDRIQARAAELRAQGIPAVGFTGDLVDSAVADKLVTQTLAA